MKIAICGKMCSGKSTIADHIMRTLPGHKKYSFAKKVKDLCVELFDMKYKDRNLLINFANKMRDIDPNVWINQIFKQTQGNENCIIDDLRYQNEVDALINDGWIIIQINISYTLQKQRIMKLYPDTFKEHLNASNHISEKNNFILPNDHPHLKLYVNETNQDKIFHDINVFLIKFNK